MAKIIPAILANSVEEISEKIKLVEPYADWVQIDVSDGKFTPNVTWNRPGELQNVYTTASLEIHLMIANVENYIEAWANAGAQRIIIPVTGKESLKTVKEIAEIIKDRGVEFGIALNPEVTIEAVKEVIPLANVVLLLSVHPGYQGQEFLPGTFEKIKELRRQFPDATIEVDGGINPMIAKHCIDAGADTLVVGSHIFSAKNKEEAITLLENHD